MEQVIEQHGWHILVQSEDGFVWTMNCKGGMRWYWHPTEGQWTCRPCTSATREEATAGFDPEAPLAEGVQRRHDLAPLAGIPQETPGAADGRTTHPLVGR